MNKDFLENSYLKYNKESIVCPRPFFRLVWPMIFLFVFLAFLFCSLWHTLVNTTLVPYLESPFPLTGKTEGLLWPQGEWWTLWPLLIPPGKETGENTVYTRNPIYTRDNKMVLVEGARLGLGQEVMWPCWWGVPALWGQEFPAAFMEMWTLETWLCLFLWDWQHFCSLKNSGNHVISMQFAFGGLLLYCSLSGFSKVSLEFPSCSAVLMKLWVEI